MKNVVWSKVHAGLYVVTLGDEKLGTVRGDYRTGFWAHLNGGENLNGTFSAPSEAAEVLALHVSLRASTSSEVSAPAVRPLA